MSEELLRHALTWAERGWHVFPCAPGAKPPAFRGEDWQELSTTDPARIERWWKTRPFNIGIDCGKSGLTVLDLDVPGHGRHAPEETAGRRTGNDTLLSLCEQQGQPMPDATFTVRTPSGGSHLYYLAPAIAVGNSWQKLGELIDARGAGGYVIAAGSTVNGKAYTIASHGPLVPFPSWIADLHEKKEPRPYPHLADPPSPVRDSGAWVRAALAHEARSVAETREYPDFALNRAAFKLGQLAGAGLLTRDEIRADLAEASAQSGLTARQIVRAIERGMTAGEHSPRRPPDSTQRPGLQVPPQREPGRVPRQ